MNTYRTVVWKYTFALVPAGLMSLFGEFCSRSYTGQLTAAGILGLAGAAGGFLLYRSVVHKHVILRWVLLASVSLLLFGVFMMVRRWDNPYKYLKGAKITEEIRFVKKYS